VRVWLKLSILLWMRYCASLKQVVCLSFVFYILKKNPGYTNSLVGFVNPLIKIYSTWKMLSPKGFVRVWYIEDITWPRGDMNNALSWLTVLRVSQLPSKQFNYLRFGRIFQFRALSSDIPQLPKGVYLLNTVRKLKGIAFINTIPFYNILRVWGSAVRAQRS